MTHAEIHYARTAKPRVFKRLVVRPLRVPGDGYLTYLTNDCLGVEKQQTRQDVQAPAFFICRNQPRLWLELQSG